MDVNTQVLLMIAWAGLVCGALAIVFCFILLHVVLNFHAKQWRYETIFKELSHTDTLLLRANTKLDDIARQIIVGQIKGVNERVEGLSKKAS